MSKEDNHGTRKGRNARSRSDTQGGDKPIDMEGQEEAETSRSVNEDHLEPDEEDERVDEKID